MIREVKRKKIANEYYLMHKNILESREDSEECVNDTWGRYGKESHLQFTNR